jgi:hypothetical protein
VTTPSPPQQPSTPGSWPIGLLVLLAVAAVFFVLMLGNAMKPMPSGDASVGAALEMLFLTAALWTVLIVMLVVAGATGSMPRWAAWLAGVLVPMSGVANVTAVDMCSRHMPWAIVFLLLLAPLIAFYALWARLPWLQARLPAEGTSVAVWAAVFFLSVASFVAAA